jgi:hypothetical protein
MTLMPRQLEAAAAAAADAPPFTPAAAMPCYFDAAAYAMSAAAPLSPRDAEVAAHGCRSFSSADRTLPPICYAMPRF